MATAGLTEEQIERLKNAFNKLDKNGDGVISREDVGEAVIEWLKNHPEYEEVVKSKIAAFKENHPSGTLTFEEFATLIVEKVREFKASQQ